MGMGEGQVPQWTSAWLFSRRAASAMTIGSGGNPCACRGGVFTVEHLDPPHLLGSPQQLRLDGLMLVGIAVGRGSVWGSMWEEV